MTATFKVQARTSTADRRIAALKVYYAQLVYRSVPKSLPGWRFLILDDKNEFMTFDPFFFYPVQSRSEESVEVVTEESLKKINSDFRKMKAGE